MTNDQYSISKILGIWFVVTLPMGFFSWILVPAIIPHIPLHPGLVLWICMVIGMVWQFVVSMVILKKELKEFTWKNIKERLWLQHPVDPKTGATNKRLYLWVIPVIFYTSLVEQTGIFEFVSSWIIRIAPFVSPPWYMNMQELAKPEFAGQWWILGLAVVSSVFNYVLGEELLFRGILLPKMRGAFGKWDWAVNGILFATYHVHRLSEVPILMLGSIFYGLPTRKFKSFWLVVIIHGIEAIPLLIGILAVMLGMG